MRRFLFFILCGIAVLSATAARGALQFDVFLGYDGIVAEASWFPVVCEIKNDGPSFAGVVEVAPGSYAKGQTYELPVELPTGTLKRLVIPAFSPNRYPSSWDVRLLDDRGRVRAEQLMMRPQQQIGWDVPLVGSLSRTAGGAPVIQRILRDQPDLQPAVARFQRAIFPDNPLVLEGMTALYLSSEVAADLRVGQVDALLGWLNAGGHLIVGIEQVSDVTASPWLRTVLPCEPVQFRALSGHPQIQDWLRSPGSPTNRFAGYSNQPRGNRPSPARGTASASNPFADLPQDINFEMTDLQVATGLLRDGRVLVAAGETPLIVTASRGKGKVTALMFSPEREPFKSWKNLPVFWAKLVEVPGNLYVSSDYNASYGQSSDGIFGAMIDSRQVHKLPIGWLLLLLVVYLVVIGPLDQFCLKRIGKPMLTWVTFPCYVVLFSLLIYFIGYKLRSGESEYNELHVVDVLANGDHAELRGRTYASLYSPSNQKFALASGLKFATLRGEFLSSGAGAATERATVWQTGDNFKAEVFVPVWTSQLYISDWWSRFAGPGPISVSLARQGESWQVTVQNHLDHALTRAQLVIEGRVLELGDLPAGRTQQVKLAPGGGVSLRDFVLRNGRDFQNAVQQRQRAFGESSGGRLSDLPGASMAASFVTQLGQEQNYWSFVAPPGLDLTRTLERGNAVLLGWMDNYAPVKPMNQFKPRHSSQQTLWRITVQSPGS